MQAALGLLKSSPTTRTRILSELNGACALRTAHACVVAVMQRVVWQMMHSDIVPDLCRGPVRQGIQFDQPEMCIPFEFFCFAACGRLIAADARHPGVQFRYFSLERINLSNLAT
jgi:hypothetical protein